MSVHGGKSLFPDAQQEASARLNEASSPSERFGAELSALFARLEVFDFFRAEQAAQRLRCSRRLSVALSQLVSCESLYASMSFEGLERRLDLTAKELEACLSLPAPLLPPVAGAWPFGGAGGRRPSVDGPSAAAEEGGGKPEAGKPPPIPGGGPPPIPGAAESGRRSSEAEPEPEPEQPKPRPRPGGMGGMGNAAMLGELGAALRKRQSTADSIDG